jgi:hypothetical protein
MTNHLYEVKLEYTIFVMASCEEDAEMTARESVDREVPDRIDAREMKPGDPAPQPWVNGLPYGSTDDDMTVGKIIEGMKP